MPYQNISDLPDRDVIYLQDGSAIYTTEVQ